MIKLGLTGGIGSGKSTIAKVFESLGVVVYFADVEAKKFLEEELIIQQLASLYGAQIIDNKGAVDKAVLASIVFTNQEELDKLNALIHPLLEQDFLEWADKRKEEPYIVKEAAILFEAGFDKSVDKILSVSAPIEQRINRVMLRDNINRQQVMDRMSKQWNDEQREAKSDFIVNNADNQMVLESILEIHNTLI